MKPILIQRGIKIEHHLSPPRERREGITDALRAMKPGDSFTLPRAARGSAYSCARALGVRVRVQALNATTIRVWLVA